MSNINIGKNIATLRFKRNITQGDLATYLGVTKASVSKWETGQSYPDILMLPKLATYFGITIDQLMSYEPQMSDGEISRLYLELYQEFQTNPFEEVYLKWKRVVDEYYTCYPLLLQMGILLLQSITFEDEEKNQSIYEDAIKIFSRIYQDSDDQTLKDWADYMEASCLVALGRPKEAIDLIKPRITYSSLAHDDLLAMAYVTDENFSESERTMQIGIYEKILSLMGSFITYIMLSQDDDKVLATLKRADVVIDTFHLEKLMPTVYLSTQFSAAARLLTMKENIKTAERENESLNKYGKDNLSIKSNKLILKNQNLKEQTLDCLEHAVDIMTKPDLKLYLNGDEYFDQIEDWIKKKEIEYGLTNHIREHQDVEINSVIDSMFNHEIFDELKDEPRYKILLKKLDAKKVGNQ